MHFVKEWETYRISVKVRIFYWSDYIYKVHYLSQQPYPIEFETKLYSVHTMTRLPVHQPDKV